MPVPWWTPPPPSYRSRTWVRTTVQIQVFQQLERVELRARNVGRAAGNRHDRRERDRAEQLAQEKSGPHGPLLEERPQLQAARLDPGERGEPELARAAIQFRNLGLEDRHLLFGLRETLADPRAYPTLGDEIHEVVEPTALSTELSRPRVPGCSSPAVAPRAARDRRQAAHPTPGDRLAPTARQPEQTTLADAAVAGRREDRGPSELARADLHVSRRGARHGLTQAGPPRERVASSSSEENRTAQAASPLSPTRASVGIRQRAQEHGNGRPHAGRGRGEVWRCTAAVDYDSADRSVEGAVLR